MMQLTYFPAYHSYAFINDASTLQPIPMGLGRELWFSAKQEALDAAVESGYWIDNDMARTH